ncbi:MAG: glycosyltransferase [Patescibacteria group bacterium]
MPKIDLLMLNMGTFYDWDHGIVNRNRFVLQNFEKDERVNKILAVDFLPVKLKQALRFYWQNLLLENKDFEMIYGDLLSACYQRNPKLYTYTTVQSFFSLRQVAKEIKKMVEILKLENPVIWSCNPMFVELLDLMPENKFVFDTVDNWLEHPVYPKIMPTARLNENYSKIAKKADFIFAVSESMVKFFKEKGRNENVHWLPNGVDYDHFNNLENINKKTELTDEKRRILGYLGTIENRVDLDLLKMIAEKNPDKLLAICGPIWADVKEEFVKKLGNLANVKSFGRIPFALSPAYLNKFDVALIPHKMSAFVESMNPMKLYDYLACGKPIVTTPGAGTENFSHLLYIANNNDDFLQKIDLALQDDSEIKQQLRRDAAKERSWNNVVGEMANKILI